MEITGFRLRRASDSLVRSDSIRVIHALLATPVVEAGLRKSAWRGIVRATPLVLSLDCKTPLRCWRRTPLRAGFPPARVACLASDIKPDPQLGLPTTADRDKYMAFIKILTDRKARLGEIQNPIGFRAYELPKHLGLTDAGYRYEEVNAIALAINVRGQCSASAANVSRPGNSPFRSDRGGSGILRR